MPRLLLCLLLAVAALLALPRAARAAICVWRKPDADIKAFFPGADSYRTDLKPVGAHRAAKRLHLARTQSNIGQRGRVHQRPETDARHAGFLDFSEDRERVGSRECNWVSSGVVVCSSDDGGAQSRWSIASIVTTAL